MQIIFSNDFILHTDGRTQIVSHGKTVAENLQYTFNALPQLLVHLSSNKGEEACKTSIKLNGEYICETDSLWNSVEETDVLEFGKDIPNGENSAARIIVGAALVIAAIAMPAAWAGVAAWVGGAGVSLVVGGVAEMIVGTPKLPGDTSSNSSATYGFSGIQNTTAPGTPIPIVYGTHRVGGHILNVYTEYEESLVNETATYLLTQLGVSEGEIENISSIEINKQPAINLVDVEETRRMGTATQSSAPPALPVGVESANNTRVRIPVAEVSVIPVDGYVIQNSKAVNRVFIKLECSTQPLAGAWSAQGLNDFYMWLEDSSGNLLTARHHEKTKSGVAAVGNAYIDFTLDDYVTGELHVKFTNLGTNQYLRVYEYSLIDSYYTTRLTATPTLQAGFSEIRNTRTVNQQITTDGTVDTTVTEVSRMYLVISAPALVWGSTGTSVTFSVSARDINVVGSTFAPLAGWPATYTISSAVATKSERILTVHLELPTISTWAIKLTRITPDRGGDISYADTIYLKHVTEVSGTQHSYPHTALLGLRVRATAQLQGSMPTITSLVQGIKVALPTGYDGTHRNFMTQWDGTLTYEEGTNRNNKYWTDNPVWCLYDIITNKRYGLGNYFKIRPEKKGLMLANFKLMADYCDERITDTGTAPITQETFSYTLFGKRISQYTTESSRHRFSLNVVLDESKSAIEWLNVLCASMRASLYYTEGCVYIDIDRPKPVTQLFTMSSILDYTQTCASRSGVPNTYEVQYVSEAHNYERTTLLVEDPELQTDATTEIRTKTLQLVGVTDEKHARSLAKYVLYAGKTARTNVTFKTGTQGLRSMIGDVIGVQHDVPQWGVGGRITSNTLIDEELGGLINLGLSTPFMFEKDSEQNWYEYSICVSQAGHPPVIYSIPLQGLVGELLDSIIIAGGSGVGMGGVLYPEFTPAVGAEYIIGLTTNVVKLFRIVSLKRDPDEKIEVVAVEYNEGLYAAVDNIEDTGGVYRNLYQTITEPIKVSVKNFTAIPKIYTDSAGMLKTTVVLNYTVPTDTYWSGAIIKYGIGSYSTTLPVNRDGYLELPEITKEGLYQFIALSTYRDGSLQLLSESTAIATLTVGPAKPISSYFTSGVTGLSIDKMANDGTFIGKDCKIVWRKPLVYNQDVAAGDSPAGTEQTNNLLSHYNVTIRGITNNVLKRTEATKLETYTYTYEMNRHDATDGDADRRFTVEVIAVDTLGRQSEPVAIECYNPAPAKLI